MNTSFQVISNVFQSIIFASTHIYTYISQIKSITTIPNLSAFYDGSAVIYSIFSGEFFGYQAYFNLNAI